MAPEWDVLLYQVETYKLRVDAENFREFLNETHVTRKQWQRQSCWQSGQLLLGKTGQIISSPCGENRDAQLCSLTHPHTHFNIIHSIVQVSSAFNPLYSQHNTHTHTLWVSDPFTSYGARFYSRNLVSSFSDTLNTHTHTHSRPLHCDVTRLVFTEGKGRGGRGVTLTPDVNNKTYYLTLAKKL